MDTNRKRSNLPADTPSLRSCGATLNDALDIPALAARYAARQRIQIRDVREAKAAAMPPLHRAALINRVCE